MYHHVAVFQNIKFIAKNVCHLRTVQHSTAQHDNPAYILITYHCICTRMRNGGKKEKLESASCSFFCLTRHSIDIEKKRRSKKGLTLSRKELYKKKRKTDRSWLTYRDVNEIQTICFQHNALYTCFFRFIYHQKCADGKMQRKKIEKELKIKSG